MRLLTFPWKYYVTFSNFLANYVHIYPLLSILKIIGIWRSIQDSCGHIDFSTYHQFVCLVPSAPIHSKIKAPAKRPKYWSPLLGQPSMNSVPRPSECGCYAQFGHYPMICIYVVVRVLWIHRVLHTLWISSLSTFLPWFVNTSYGYPNLEKNSLIKALAVTSAFCNGSGTHSTTLYPPLWVCIGSHSLFEVIVKGNQDELFSIGLPAYYLFKAGQLEMDPFYFYNIHHIWEHNSWRPSASN